MTLGRALTRAIVATSNAGVVGEGTDGVGVRGLNRTNNAEGFLDGTNPFAVGLPMGVFGQSDHTGVAGITNKPNGVGVYGGSVGGRSPSAGNPIAHIDKAGVFGASQDGAGVVGYASRPAADVFGVAAFGGLLASAVTNPLAAKFEGNVQVDGDIFLSGADCAEHFDVADARALEPGTVMVINNTGILEPSSQASDKRVAGGICGAGSHKTGIVLDKQPSEEHRKPIALIGKVNCKVDARHSPVEVGDLLTTSPTPGHAMKASEPRKAFGSVIGKALRELREGQGLIPILIALQ
jgi:hypothetical protein